MKNSIKRIQSERSLSPLLSARILREAKNRTITYAALALMTLGFAGCQQEEDFTPQGGVDGQEIRLATRATTYDGNDDNFTEGQVMTVGH